MSSWFILELTREYVPWDIPEVFEHEFPYEVNLLENKVFQVSVESPVSFIIMAQLISTATVQDFVNESIIMQYNTSADSPQFFTTVEIPPNPVLTVDVESYNSAMEI